MIRPPDPSAPQLSVPTRPNWASSLAWLRRYALPAGIVTFLLAGPIGAALGGLGVLGPGTAASLASLVQMLALALVLGDLLIELRAPLMRLRGAIALALAFALALNSDQGVETLRAMSQASPFVFLLAAGGTFSFTLYLCVVIHGIGMVGLGGPCMTTPRTRMLLDTISVIPAFAVFLGALKVLGVPLDAGGIAQSLIALGRDGLQTIFVPLVQPDPAARITETGQATVGATMADEVSFSVAWRLLGGGIGAVFTLIGWFCLLIVPFMIIGMARMGALFKTSSERVGLYLGVAFGLILPISALGFLFDESWDVPAPVFLAGWCTLLVTLLWGIGILGQRIRAPLIILLLAWALLLSAFDMNDNHGLAYRREAPERPAPPLAREAFAAWRGQTAPPATAFIIVAEGGGARAAYMTALVTEALRTQCEAFARAHFATIGVSGGSVGAALSAAAPPARGGDCTTVAGFDPARSIPTQAAGADLLRPVLRGALTTDLLLRLWPSSGGADDGRPGVLHNTPFNWFADRAQHIEWRLDLAWREASGGAIAERLAKRSFRDSWDPATPSRPALILLGTDVNTGRRVAASHLRFGPVHEGTPRSCASPLTPPSTPAAERARLLTLAEIAPGRDPTLLAAAVMSARFPLVTPAATLPCDGPRWRVVDGGYFENSGLTTALELVEAIATGTAARPTHVVLIRLENGGATTNAATRRGLGDDPPPSYLGELLSPVRAVLGTREARADQARALAEEALARRHYGAGCRGHITAAAAQAPLPAGCVRLTDVRIRLTRCSVAIPLGWSLSESARVEIARQLGFADQSSFPACAADAAENRSAMETVLRIAAGRGP